MNKTLFLLASASMLGLSGCSSAPKLEVTTSESSYGGMTFINLKILSKDENKLEIKEIIANNDYIATDEDVICNPELLTEDGKSKIRNNIASLKKTSLYASLDTNGGCYSTHIAQNYSLSMGEERNLTSTHFCKKGNPNSCEKMDTKIVKINIQTDHGNFGGNFQ